VHVCTVEKFYRGKRERGHRVYNIGVPNLIKMALMAAPSGTNLRRAIMAILP